MKEQLKLHTTTLWDYSSQQHKKKFEKGHKEYIGATPTYIINNLLLRYTKKKDLVVDPMVGSGTTIDVARELSRRALGYDINPVALKRSDVFKSDARKLPLENEKADFVFVDPPYSDHIKYSDEKNCIGKLNASENKYYDEMGLVIKEIHRVLKHDRYMALYVSDSFETGKNFMPIGFRLFSILEQYFVPVDIVSVVRHNKDMEKKNYKIAAAEQNFFLRGFNYLFIMYKPNKNASKNLGKNNGVVEMLDRRNLDEYNTVEYL